MTPQERYDELVAALVATTAATWEPAPVSGRRSFGAGALRVDGRILAMLTRDRLVLKLPRARVEALVASGDGRPFDPGHGRLMREWLELDPGSALDWESLAREALAFVGGLR